MWIVLGTGAETHLVEWDNGVPYEEAKKSAIEKMGQSIQPVLARLEEIKQDIDFQRNQKPCFKAWQGYRELVVAQTKKRAAELVGVSISTLSRSYEPCQGWWWYPFAKEESVWKKQPGVPEVWKREK